MNHTTGDDEKTAFPATEATPGQAVSRQARQRFLDQAKDIDGKGHTCPWMEDYLQLRLEGWDWRKAAYIAWAASPRAGRWPESQQKLALEVLGLKSDRTIRTWIEKNPEIEDRVARLQVEPLMLHRRDAIMSLIRSTEILGRDGAQDRRLFFTLTGDLAKKGGEGTERKGHGQASPYADMSDEELDQVIRNLKAAGGLDAGDGDEPDGDQTEA